MTNNQMKKAFTLPKAYKAVYFDAAEVGRLVEFIQNCAVAAGEGNEEGKEALDENLEKLAALVAEMKANARDAQ